MSLDNPTLTFIDADSIYFKICYKTKKKHEIRKSIRYKIDRIERLTSADGVMLAVKGKDNYRNLIYPEYKANRKPLEPDMKKALTYAHEFIVGELGAVQADGMEADDVVSIWAHEAIEKGWNYTIAGIDKDLLQIPGVHFNFDKEQQVEISEDQGHLRLMAQSLTGDGTDNIPGIKGIGPAKAAKILDGVPAADRWDRVCRAWTEHNAGDPLLSYHLLKMLTYWEERDELLASYISGESCDSESDERPLPREEADTEQAV